MRYFGTGALLLAALLAAGCSKSAPESAEDNLANETVAVPEPEPVENGAVAVEPVNEAKPDENASLPEPPSMTEEEQMRDDADAVGMTSRLPPTEDSGADAGGNSGQ